MTAYRQHLGFDALPAPYEAERMIVAYKNRKAYSLRRVAAIKKSVLLLLIGLMGEHEKGGAR